MCLGKSKREKVRVIRLRMNTPLHFFFKNIFNVFFLQFKLKKKIVIELGNPNCSL